jgi:hypothetical protein
VNRLDDYILENYAKRFREWRYQKVYLKFEDKEGKIHLFLGCKRGNTKHLRKIRRKLKQIEAILSKNIINRDKSNIAFITITFNRNCFLNNTYAWKFVSEYTNDFLENLKKKLRKKGNDIEFFLKTYEYHKDYYPHVHLILKLKKPLYTFMYKGKKRFASKRKLFEWSYGFTDVEAPKNIKHVLSYLIKYCVKNYFEPANEQKNMNNQDKTLTILWLFRKNTISHSRIRLDILESKLTYSMTFKGLIIIEYTTYFEEFIRKNYKLKEIEYFKLDKDGKLLQFNNQICTQPSRIELGNMFT